jgi:Ca-activated chloride channel homolog
MRRLNSGGLLAAVIAGLLAVSLDGQGDPVFRADTNFVVLHTTVADRSGKLVTDLPQKAFKVYENNVEQQLKVFRREDIPVSLGLVIDNSGSMKERRLKVEAAALQLVKGSNPQDQTFIVNFNDESYLDCGFTSSVPKLEEALARLDSRGGTAVRDAISMSIDYMKENAKLDKKIVFVVTDGDDNMSSITLEQLVQKAQQSEVLIYAIGLLNEEDRRVARRAERAMNTITEASGGAAYYPKELAEVGEIALRVAHEVRNQFTLAYTPANPALDGSYRQIRVTVEGPNRPIARTRTGYYATPEPRARQAASKVATSN